MHTTRRFFLAMLTIVVGIAVPMTVKPGAAVLVLMWSLIGVALLVTLLTWEPVARRVPFLAKRRVDEDPALPIRDDRRDLADDLTTYASRVADWLDARGVQAPRILDENAAPIGGKRTLGELCASQRSTRSVGKRISRRPSSTTE